MNFNKPGGNPEKLREQMEAEALKWTPREEINEAQAEPEHPIISQIKDLLGAGRGPSSIKSDYYDQKMADGVIRKPLRDAAVSVADGVGPHTTDELDQAEKAELMALSTDPKPDEARINQLVTPRSRRKKQM